MTRFGPLVFEVGDHYGFMWESAVIKYGDVNVLNYCGKEGIPAVGDTIQFNGMKRKYAVKVTYSPTICSKC